MTSLGRGRAIALCMLMTGLGVPAVHATPLGLPPLPIPADNPQ